MGEEHIFLKPLYDAEGAVVTLDLAAVRRERARLDAVADRRYRLEL
jgi:hypothetical protein